ncbi:hypothetical protein QBC43DRAFT_323360 [Cladorrhinum sp. PSN259]|nr:hypothetical protein QBC43DRAFT_323360 [Cladorrhinum sp. PSN259]
MVFPVSNAPYLWEQAGQPTQLTKPQLPPYLWELPALQAQERRQRVIKATPRRLRVSRFDSRGLPICNCHYFFQYHSCGCPDNITKGSQSPRYQKHIPSLRKCAVHFFPLHRQIDLTCRGFRHVPPGPNLPFDNTPRILPFPCYKHQEECRITLSQSQMETRLKRMNDPLQNPRLRQNANKKLLEQQALRREHATHLTPLVSSVGLKRRRSQDDVDGSSSNSSSSSSSSFPTAKRVVQWRPQDEPTTTPLYRRLSVITPPSSSSPSPFIPTPTSTRKPSLLDVCAIHRALRTMPPPTAAQASRRRKSSSSLALISPLPLLADFLKKKNTNPKTPLIIDPVIREGLSEPISPPFSSADNNNIKSNAENGATRRDFYPGFGRVSWEPFKRGDHGSESQRRRRKGKESGTYESGAWIEDEVRILEAAALAWGERGVSLADVVRCGITVEDELDM